MLILPTPNQHSPGIPSRTIRQEEEIQIGKETAKISLFTDDMILYLKDPKTPRHHKQAQQCSRLQNQFIKISSLSIYQQ
jgi:hypothetical protein